MRNKSAPQPDGRRQMQCPAAGSHPLVKCAFKLKSVDVVIATRQPDGTVADARPEIIINENRMINGVKVNEDEKPNCCSKPTFTLQPEDGLKHRQGLRYGTTEHTRVHQALRNAQEGLHNFLKDDQHEALSAPGRRRTRGIAAQSLYQAIGMAVASLRKIVFFLKEMRTDADGRRYVLRDLDPTNEDGLPLGVLGYRDELDKIEEGPPDPA